LGPVDRDRRIRTARLRRVPARGRRGRRIDHRTGGVPPRTIPPRPQAGDRPVGAPDGAGRPRIPAGGDGRGCPAGLRHRAWTDTWHHRDHGDGRLVRRTLDRRAVPAPTRPAGTVTVSAASVTAGTPGSASPRMPDASRMLPSVSAPPHRDLPIEWRTDSGEFIDGPASSDEDPPSPPLSAEDLLEPDADEQEYRWAVRLRIVAI